MFYILNSKKDSGKITLIYKHFLAAAITEAANNLFYFLSSYYDSELLELQTLQVSYGGQVKKCLLNSEVIKIRYHHWEGGDVGVPYGLPLSE